MVNVSGCMTVQTTKQGNTTHGSTESEILGVDEEMRNYIKGKVQNHQTGTITTNVTEFQKPQLIKDGLILLDN